MKKLPPLKKLLPTIGVAAVAIIMIVAIIIAIAARAASVKKDNPGEQEPPPVIETQTPEPSKSPTPSETPTPTPTPTEPEGPPEPPYDGPRNPLTGLPCTEEALTLRPMAIMMNNLSIAQPQLGISKADIIYEVPVEGGITRMLAIYQDVTDVGVIGSVRSARPYYLDLAQGHDAVYIHAGGSPQAYELLSSRSITHLDGVNGKKQDIFYRDSNRRQTMGYEHSLVTSSERILKFLPTYGIRLAHEESYKVPMVFADDAAPKDGKAATKFDVVFSSAKKTSFEYNTEDGKYYVSQNNKAYKDGTDGSQVAATNVLILKTKIGQISGDKEGRLTVSLTGTGSGYFICGGKTVEINWSKAGANSSFVYTLKDGSELTFGTGRTYICILSQDVNVDIK